MCIYKHLESLPDTSSQILEASPDTPSLAKNIDTPLNQDSKGKLEETFLFASLFVKAHKSLYKIQDRFREKLMFSKAGLRDSHLLDLPLQLLCLTQILWKQQKKSVPVEVSFC